MTTRKKYTKEFKQDAVRLVTEQGYRQTVTQRRSVWSLLSCTQN